MTIADYVQRAMKANFGAAWEELASSEMNLGTIQRLYKICMIFDHLPH